MKRYEPPFVDNNRVKMEEYLEGDYILYEDHLKAMEEQRKACAYEFMQHMRLVNFEYRGDKYTLKQAILNATIEDKDNA